MNSVENEIKRQSSENLPVFFTGLAEAVTKEPKRPLLCLLCGSSLVNKAKSDSLEGTNNYNGCENCAKTFNNIKAALELLSKIAPAPLTTPSHNQPPELKIENGNINQNKRKSLLPHPVNPPTPNGMVISPHMNTDYNNYDDSVTSDYNNYDDSITSDYNNYDDSITSDYNNYDDSIVSDYNNYDDSMASDYNNHDDTMTPNYNNIQKGSVVQNDKTPDLKRKNNFHSDSSKRPRKSFSPRGNSYRKAHPRSISYDKLGNSIWQLYMKHKQTQNVYDKKMTLRDKLHEMLQTAFPTCGLYVVGSSMTGLGAKSSDMDMCLMLTHDEIDQEREATNILHTVRDVFLNCNFLRNVEVIYAKVPILRFTDCVSEIEVDLNVNNAVGIRNTQLLSSYARIDERFPPLVLLVKMGARYHGINDAKNNSLSSYSLVLMVIHFLQCGCKPPVLPCLQQLQQEKYRPNSDVQKLKLKEELPDFTSENTMNLGDLFIGFLNYFSFEFDYFRSVMSVRLGGIIPKEIAMNNTYSSKNKRAHWKWVCIEEPFDLTNTACAVFKPGVFHYIRQVFANSCTKLKNTADLGSILQ